MKYQKFISVILVCLCLIPLYFHSIKPAKADAIDTAISLAESYLDRAYHEVNSTHAVCKDYPSLPFRVYDETDNHWIPLSKEYADVQSIARFKGGCKIEHIKSGHAFVFGDNNERWYKWETGNDRNYDDLILWCEDSSMNNTHIWVHVAVKNYPSHTFDIYIGDDKIIDNAKYDDGWTGIKYRGWFSQRYPLRHATRLMQWYYEDRYAETGFSGWLERANRLKNTMDGIGYTVDVYAPLWNKSLNYADSSFPNITMYPDYMLKDKWLWNDQAIPYSSHLSSYITVSGWLAYITIGGNPLFDFITAIHLMNKYPNDDAMLDKAKELIDRAKWNGYGVSGYRWKSWDIYKTYTTAVYLMAVGRYYQLTLDTYYKERCEEAVKILLGVQLIDGKTITWDIFGDVYRADSIGGFLISYTYDEGLKFKGQNEAWYVEIGLNALSFLGLSVHDADEYQCPILTNTETTLIVWKALKFYKSLNLPSLQTPIAYNNGISIPFKVNCSSSGYPPATARAFDNGYVELYAFGPERWANASFNYNFTPIDTRNQLEIGFNVKARVHYDGSNLGADIKLLLISSIKNLNTSQIVWWKNETLINVHGGNWFEIPEVFNQNFYFNYYIPHIFNVSNVYQVEIKFCGYVQDVGASYLDLANMHPLDDFVTRLKVEGFRIKKFTPKCAMKTKTDGYFYIPQLANETLGALKIELWCNDSNPERAIGDQIGGISPYPEINQYPDGIINICDMSLITGCYGSNESSDNWTYMADVVPDHVIDICDVCAVNSNYGQDNISYSFDMSGVTVTFNGSEPISVSSDGVVFIPQNATSFIVERNGEPILAMVIFF